MRLMLINDHDWLYFVQFFENFYGGEVVMFMLLKKKKESVLFLMPLILKENRSTDLF